MKYLWVPPQNRFRGPVHWGHQIHLYVSGDRFAELHAFLDEVVGKDRWRLSRPFFKDIPEDGFKAVQHHVGNRFSKPTRIKFLTKEHAFRTKLMWEPCPGPALDSVLISLVRRVMPAAMAADIIGVQPMTGPWDGPSLFLGASTKRVSTLPKWKRRKRGKRARL